MSRKTHPFFNTRVFVRTLEEALRIAWERHETGHPPADVKVTDMPGRQ
jgi:hypothetical protein